MLLRQTTLIILLLLLALPLSARGEKGIAVVKGRFDVIEKVLDAYKIDYEILEYRHLQELRFMKQFRLIFFPCGMEPPLHENIRLKSEGRGIHSVTIREEINSISKDTITDNIRRFIDEGGSAYFSGHTVSFLQKAYGDFTFFDKFPYMGMPGRFIAHLKDDMAHFNIKNEMAVYMTHSGWITLKKVNNASILASAAYETPRGTKEGPIALLMRRGEGEVIYTAYHSTIFSDYRRFNIYRLTGNHLLASLKEEIQRWEQETTALLSDSFHKNEAVRTYRIPLRMGMNTVYIISEKNPLQVDILDRDSRMIISSDNHKRYEEIDIPSARDDFCILRIFPDSKNRYSLHAVATARGKRILPHLTIVIIVGGIVATLLLLLFVSLVLERTKYSPPGFRRK